MTASGDQILIEGLSIACVIGIHPWERVYRQQLIIDLAISTDTRAAAAADDITKTVDYVSAANLCRQLAVTGQFRLIESLAATIANTLLEQNGVDAVNVTIRKPAAVAEADTVAIQLQRP